MKPRGTQARRRQVALGRLRVTLLVTGIALTGAGSGVVTAGAQAPESVTETVAAAVETVTQAAPQPVDETPAAAPQDPAPEPPVAPAAPPPEPVAPPAEATPADTGTSPTAPAATDEPVPTTPTSAPEAPATPAAEPPLDAAPATATSAPAEPAASTSGGRPAKRARKAAPRPTRTRATDRPAPVRTAPAAPRPAPKATPAPPAHSGLGTRAEGSVAAESADRPAPGRATARPASFRTLDPLLLPAGAARDVPVPAGLLPLFQAAGAEHGIPWEVLAAINEIETNFGENQGPSSAGALGWMQFMPATWEHWGVDADGDRKRDPANPYDAIFAAGKYLADHGGAEDLRRAVFAYNHADWYVRDVLHRARELAALDQDAVAALSRAGRAGRTIRVADPTPGQALLLNDAAVRREALQMAQVQGCGAEDIRSGRIDRRVVATLVYLAAQGLRPTVSSLECDHGTYTAGGNVSAHSYGHAVDIAVVDGTPVLGHQGKGSITERTLSALVRLQGEMRPNQIISLMTVPGHDNTLAMADHHDHVHVGFPRQARLGPTDQG